MLRDTEIANLFYQFYSMMAVCWASYSTIVVYSTAYPFSIFLPLC